MRVIFLMMIMFGLLNAEFIRSNDMVTDTQTGLIWQDNELSGKMLWTDAIDYCETLTLDNKYDWKLPNKKELLSLLIPPSLEISPVFQNMDSSSYWSSTTYIESPNSAWYYERFYTYHGSKSDYTANVRCVR